jgi:acetyl-CoA acetyltransferase
MLSFLKKFFGAKPTVSPCPEVPYKVETPAPVAETAPAVKKVLAQVGLSIDQIDVIELNEAFAAQGLAVLREIGVADDDSRVNPNGGAIALGHPLGASGARIITTALNQLERTQAKYALCTMCIGVGQGIAVVIERV